jgi:hypothetical protein
MADRSRPLDALGNELRVGDLVRATLQQPALNFRVIKVDAAGTIVSPDLKSIALQGTIVLQAVVPVEFAEGTMLADVYKLHEPEAAATKTQ